MKSIQRKTNPSTHQAWLIFLKVLKEPGYVYCLRRQLFVSNVAHLESVELQW